MAPPIGLQLILIREPTQYPPSGEAFTLGKLYANGQFWGHTCEDEVRKEGVKVYGRTAIPSGTYRVENSYSNRFKKVLPAILNVPGFEGIRIHGGNHAEDSLGCILLGELRSPNGVYKCADTISLLIQRINANGFAALQIKEVITKSL